MTENLPEYVYLIKPDSEWPVDAVAGDHPNTAEWVAKRVAHRRESGNVGQDGKVRVWRARLTDVEEMQLTPGRTIPPTLEPKE